MADEPIRPVPFDPSRATVVAMLDLHAGEPWLMTAAGDYHAFAVEAMKRDGSNFQSLIALQWPARANGTDDHSVVQLLIHPDDVRGLVGVLAHTLAWLDEAKRMSG